MIKSHKIPLILFPAHPSLRNIRLIVIRDRNISYKMSHVITFYTTCFIVKFLYNATCACLAWRRCHSFGRVCAVRCTGDSQFDRCKTPALGKGREAGEKGQLCSLIVIIHAVVFSKQVQSTTFFRVFLAFKASWLKDFL